ncbi:FecR family protein [Mucilaginibacter sp. OK098]|uniref:FecR family protein n=1 Tax=Mucilaginibacter sp. OK098 TaxID=1855297 RepID=UPI000921EF81|nr:FecR domain-containing protein [Mucilaginibacter sp. OK098]SHM58580.1 FecR family protein [Mucilaginibacter sp. OK098]
MSADKEHITDDALVKYLLGETNAAENRETEQWINENDANRKYYADFKLIWQESERIAANSNPDEDGAWLRLQNRISINNDQQIQPIKSASKFTWLKIAASILLISVIGYFAFDQFFGTELISNSSTVALTKGLPDGSSVTLNSNSQLSYPNHFSGGQRLVELNGEGFFKITPDKTKPFIIKINAVTVTVVGTSFNVKNVKGKTEVTVETGIVKVNSHGKQVLLHPGQKVIADEGLSNLTVQETRGSLYNYYITKALICDRTPLYELVDKLNQVYGSHIQIAGKQLHNLPITTTFKGQTLQQVLNVIAETFKIKIESKGNLILLK